MASGLGGDSITAGTSGPAGASAATSGTGAVGATGTTGAGVAVSITRFSCRLPFGQATSFWTVTAPEASVQR